MLRREHFKVLVLPASAHNEADCQHYLAVRPDISILVIDIEVPEVIVRFRDAGSEMIARVIRSLSESSASRSEHRGRVHWLSSKDFDAPATASNSSSEPYATAKEHLSDVKRWSAFVGLQLLASQDPKTDGSSITGWTIGKDEAKRLLCEVAGDLSEFTTPQALWRHMEGREYASLEHGVQLPLLQIAIAFDLDDCEKQLVWHALGPELDGRFTRIYGYLNDDLTRGRPTLTTLAQLVEGYDAWSLRGKLAGPKPFARHHLISVQDRPHGLPATVETIAPAPELVRFLIDHVDEAGGCESGATLLPPDETGDGAPEYDAEASPLSRICAAPWRTRTAPSSGSKAAARLSIGSSASSVLPASLCFGLPSAGRRTFHPPGWPAPRRVGRDFATLHHAVLLITGFEQRDNETRLKLSRICVECLAGLVPALVLHGASLESAGTGDRAVRLIERRKLTIHARAEIWHRRANHAGLNLSWNAALELAAIARFDETADRHGDQHRQGAGAGLRGDAAPALCEAVRRMARDAAPSAVQVVECTYGWGDIVLRADVLEQIKSIPDQVRFAGRVREDWGFDKRMPYGRGVAALFSGASGTGKSMAAQILASDLCTVLYRIDLSKTVSKWLGETEKILSQIFDLAQQNSAVLFFDEADVLFAKRTEVKDAHDRYANVEVAYLLQRMEDYDGLAILTTNLKQNIDQAFLRRLRFVVDFPMPDAEQREKIWRKAFPPGAPLAEDLDFRFLARRLTLTGGSIQQIAIRAAFAAVADNPENSVITMQHIVRATRQELVKLGMLGAEQTLAEMAISGAPPRKEVRA